MSDAEERRIWAEFELRQAERANAARRQKLAERPYYALHVFAVFFYSGLFAFDHFGGRSGYFILLISGSPLFFMLISMFSDLCRDTKRIRDKLESPGERA